MQSSSSETDFQQLRERWSALLNRLYDDPKVAQVMNSRAGQYLSTHPFLALALILFSIMAAVPVGLFLIFALVTIIMSAIGFVFCEVLLLFVAGLTLLSVLSGLAFFSVMVSFIVNAFYFIIFNILKYYSPTKEQLLSQSSFSPTYLTSLFTLSITTINQSKVEEKESEGETSNPKDTQ